MTPSSPGPEICVTIGTGLSPVPAKLVLRIEAAEYINMTELLPHQLGITRSLTIDNPGISEEGHYQESWNGFSVLQLTWWYVAESSLIIFMTCYTIKLGTLKLCWSTRGLAGRDMTGNSG